MLDGRHHRMTPREREFMDGGGIAFLSRYSVYSVLAGRAYHPGHRKEVYAVS